MGKKEVMAQKKNSAKLGEGKGRGRIRWVRNQTIFTEVGS